MEVMIKVIPPEQVPPRQMLQEQKNGICMRGNNGKNIYCLTDFALLACYCLQNL